MIKLNTIYRVSFYVIVLLVFCCGGFLQFTLGISNTILSIFITAICFANYFLYLFKTHKIISHKIIFWAFLYIVLIVFSGLHNNVSNLKILIYLIFPLLPLGVFLFNFINRKRGLLTFRGIFKLFFLIATLQLPFLLAQKMFYSFFIKFNRSGQFIDKSDFTFGTFFIKSDHSLGIFILIIISVLLYKRQAIKGVLRFPNFSIFYLSITLFFTESNISKLFLVILLSSFVLIPFYKKHKKSVIFKLGLLSFVCLLIFIGFSVRENDLIQKKLGGSFERQFSIESSQKFYDLGTAKRFQIVMVAVNNLKVKWIGDGPYSYFDIRKGKFKLTRHFSQFIWTYFDLGIIGLIVVLGYIFSIVSYLNIEKGYPYLIFLTIILVYTLYTTILSDIAIVFSIITVFGFKNNIKSEKLFPSSLV
tara:strand:- start:144 stop:1394 length:1251 start_codon:yes stop_codon:yes gene_type:complete